jgi:hypothetical protein
MPNPQRHVHSPIGRIVCLAATGALAACAGAPPAGSPEHAAWVKDKQELAAAIEKAGCYCGADWFRDLPTR